MAFIRVRDKETRHEFDLPEGHHLIRSGLVEPTKRKGFPPSPVVRPARHFVRLPSLEPNPQALTEHGEGFSDSKEHQ